MTYLMICILLLSTLFWVVGYFEIHFPYCANREATNTRTGVPTKEIPINLAVLRRRGSSSSMPNDGRAAFSQTRYRRGSMASHNPSKVDAARSIKIESLIYGAVSALRCS